MKFQGTWCGEVRGDNDGPPVRVVPHLSLSVPVHFPTSEGKGLGTMFLGHIRQTHAIIHVRLSV